MVRFAQIHIKIRVSQSVHIPFDVFQMHNVQFITRNSRNEFVLWENVVVEIQIMWQKTVFYNIKHLFQIGLAAHQSVKKQIAEYAVIGVSHTGQIHHIGKGNVREIGMQFFNGVGDHWKREMLVCDPLLVFYLGGIAIHGFDIQWDLEFVREIVFDGGSSCTRNMNE